MKRRWLVFAIGIVVGALLLWYALKDLELEEVWSALKVANYWWLVPAVTVYFISVWFRSWRWSYLLRAKNEVSAKRLFPVVVIGYMGNDILPFRLGEALRAYVLWRREKINIGTALTTALLERLFDGLTMVLFVFVGLQFVSLPEDLRPWITAASVAFLAVLLFFLFLAVKPELLRRLSRFFIDRLVPERFRPLLLGFVEGIVEGLESLRSGRDVLVLFGVTVWVWLLETGKYWLVSFAFPGLGLEYPAIL
ncbi:MAG: flippase-like domain-containing protein, partial [Anaerolineales bacterium]